MTQIIANPAKNIHSQFSISPYHFFDGLFPYSYFCAMRQHGQVDGAIPSLDLETDDFNAVYDSLMTQYVELNRKGYNIYLTPNGVKSVDGKNSLDNFLHINAWYIDIDINETKNISPDMEDELIPFRNKKKGEILSFIWALGLEKWPSLTIETRNGYQLYWSAQSACNVENWHGIEAQIFETFKHLGADKSTIKIVQLMRVPGFQYHKNGEKGNIEIVWPFSTFKLWEEKEMMKIFPPIYKTVSPLEEEERMKEEQSKMFYETLKNYVPKSTEDIFKKIISMPVDQVLLQLSGTWLVNFEKITLGKQHTEKTSVLIDGKMTPNWIDRKKNMIFSNTQDGFCNIIHYCGYYGHSKGKIAQGMKELFFNK